MTITEAKLAASSLTDEDGKVDIYVVNTLIDRLFADFEYTLTIIKDKNKQLDDNYSILASNFQSSVIEINELKDSISCEGCIDHNMGSIYGCNTAMLVCNRMVFDDRYSKVRRVKKF